MTPARRQPTPPARRGAAVYLTVMGVAMIVGVIALTTSLTGRMQLRANQRQADLVRAELAARSGIEHALNWLNRNDNWRTTLTSGALQTSTGTIDGSFQWSVTDEDNDLADDAREHAVLRSIGTSNSSVCVLEVDIEPAGRALTCLEAAAHAATSVIVNSGATVDGTGILSSSLNINANSATINLDAEAAGTASGSTYNGDTTNGVPQREMPGRDAFDWYIERGTEIALGDLDDIIFSSDKRLSAETLGRSVNPFGEPNPLGIYWIDCGGTNVRLRYSRLWGTLVLLNAGPDTRVEDVNLFQSEAQNYPVLMVQGDLRIDLRSAITGEELHEGLGINFNPAGMPYQGVTDSDDDDQYPAQLDGIVYATGSVTISDEATVQGSLVANSLVVNDSQTLTVEYRHYSNSYPPPGFSAGTGARVLPGSWRRVGL